jgi:hypothetical protein
LPPTRTEFLRAISIRPEFSEVQAIVMLRHPDNIVANL